jgi:putative redox protein
MKATANWISALAFEATSDNGHSVKIDTTLKGGGLDTGMSPKQMLLASLCACSGMDVVDILRKMRVKYSRLEITAEAEQTDTHPRVFTGIRMVYKTDAPATAIDQVKKAVALSQDTYCGIIAMLRKHCDIEYAIELADEYFP